MTMSGLFFYSFLPTISLWLAMNFLNLRQLEGANPLAPPDI